MKRFVAPLAALLLLAGGVVGSAGCELITSPDRSKIPNSGAGGGGTGGAGGATSCTAASECPGTDTDCLTRTCNGGVCGVDFAPQGTAVTQQTKGDCKSSVCDGMGMTTSQDDDTDVLDDVNACTEDTCAGGTPKNDPSAVGQQCTPSGKVCDGQGACVECNTGADCVDKICMAHTCSPPTCTDKAKNGDETALDCGGACPGCGDGLACAVAGDCASSVCTGMVCVPAACGDVVQNGAETDVDCGGGACPKCAPNLKCKADGDCAGDQCSGSVCVPNCADQVTNNGETDEDCGGPNCTGCADGLVCAVGTDCTSHVCTTGACAAPSCSDGVKNGNEADKDCGGPASGCALCGSTATCAGAVDCASGVCTGGTCQAASCSDGVKNGNETGKDCGGGVFSGCAACGPGGTCGAGVDCTSGICTGGVCATAACGDGVKNGADACDDGNTVSGDGCDSGCVVEFGYGCSGNAPSVCTSTCGDAEKAANEACDDGNAAAGDGCTACAVDFGFNCSGTAPSVCASSCGDGLKASDEACDDGNVNPNDGCTNGCAVQSGFTCSGNMPSVCTAICGDGVKAGAEGCDDGGTANGDGCSSLCAVEAGFNCTGAPLSTCSPICGDNLKVTGEQCDDGNVANGDCCSSTCTVEAGCEIEPNGSIATANSSTLAIAGKINGFISPIADHDFFVVVIPVTAQQGSITATTIDSFLGVTCASQAMDTLITLTDAAAVTLASNDDINGAANRCSSVTVSGLAPGSYYIDLKAYSATATFGYTLQITTTLSICGNSVIEPGEQCDGGPTCAANCTLLPVCGDNTISGAEQCDDGNTTAGDGCSAACAWETVAEIEPNDTTANADTNAATLLITGNINITGSFSAAADVDIYKVTVAAQTTARFEIFDTSGRDCISMPVSTLALLDSGGVQLKTDAPDTVASGISGCAALVFSLAPGSYYIKLGGAAAGSYFFQTRFAIDDGAEAEPNGTTGTANAFAGREVVIAGAYVSGDQDWYAITIPKNGLSIRAETVEGAAVTCESQSVDTILTLFNSVATSLVADDDDGRGYCSVIDGTGATPRDPAAHALAAGAYYLQITGYSTACSYRIALTVR